MKTILLTGASGFLGKAIYDELVGDNNVLTLSRSGGDIKVDLSIEIPDITAEIDLVIHSAGKAHVVPTTVKEKQQFFDVNLQGTSNLLAGLEASLRLPRFFIFISSVAVYGLDSGLNIDETRPLLAKDPYGRSKIEAERLVLEWCQKNNVICTILRLPLLAGQNPSGNLGAMIKGIKRGYYFNIGGGKAKKSIVLVSDVARILSKVANVGGVFNLTDRYHPTFSELSTVAAQQLGKSKPLDMPMFLGKIVAALGEVFGPKSPINISKLKKITSDLTFDDSKAAKLIGWNPTKVLTSFKIR